MLREDQKIVIFCKMSVFPPRGDNVSFELTYVFIVISLSATSAHFGHMLVDSGPSLGRWNVGSRLLPIYILMYV